MSTFFNRLRGDSSMGLPCLSKVSWITMAVGSMAQGTRYTALSSGRQNMSMSAGSSSS
ncbi:hypothetical protein D3C85_1422680 [compost metagenome]